MFVSNSEVPLLCVGRSCGGQFSWPSLLLRQPDVSWLGDRAVWALSRGSLPCSDGCLKWREWPGPPSVAFPLCERRDTGEFLVLPLGRWQAFASVQSQGYSLWTVEGWGGILLFFCVWKLWLTMKYHSGKRRSPVPVSKYKGAFSSL